MRRMHLNGAAVVLLLVSAGCASASKNLETPSGPVPGDQFGGFEILGVSHRATTSLNQARPSLNGVLAGFSEDVTINVPVGTQIIIPAIRGWRLGYGRIEPNTLEAHAGLPGAPDALRMTISDQHLGAATVNVVVRDIDAPTAAGTQTATLRVSLLLTDEGTDDEWHGMVFYSLIFLGPRTLRSP